MRASKGIEISAPAKVNLWLRVLGKRSDGYHEIDTVMQTISLADELRIEAGGDGLELAVAGGCEGVPRDEENSVLRAGRLLLERFNAAAGARMTLDKKIPPRSGLGGGSSDAAAALVGLCRLWGLDLAREELERTAAEVGSDVPFFVRGGTARCRGRGDDVEPLEARGELHVVLVFAARLSTAQVYEIHAASAGADTKRSFSCPGDQAGRVDLASFGSCAIVNDLESAAFKACPRLAEVKSRLLSAGALQAAVSGSGGCVFGIARSAPHAREIAEGLEIGGFRTAVAADAGPREV